MTTMDSQAHTGYSIEHERVVAIVVVSRHVNAEDIETYLEDVERFSTEFKTTEIVLFHTNPLTEQSSLAFENCKVRLVDLGPDELDLLSNYEPASAQRQYVSLVTALGGVHDLMLTSLDDSGTLNPNIWFEAALDARVERFHIRTPNLKPFSSLTRAYLSYACRRLHDFESEMLLYTSEDPRPWTLPRLERLGHLCLPTTMQSKKQANDKHRREIDQKLAGIFRVRSNLLDLETDDDWDEDFYQETEGRIFLLSEVIMQLLHRRNTLAPISSLPLEILSRIFMFASYQDDPYLTYGKYPPPLAWVKVSHVCQHWSDVARSNPQIWANIAPILPRWTEELLERSYPCPLNIRFTPSPYIPHGIQYSALACAMLSLDRVVNLSLAMETLCGGLNLDRPAPLLESFELQSLSTNSLFNLFGGVAPNLRRLSLHLGFFNPKSTLYRGLTFLELRNVRFEAYLSTPEFVHFLSSIRNLETLHLWSSLPALHPEIRKLPSPQETPKFCCLANLLVYDSAAISCADFLNHFTIREAGNTNDIVQLDLGLKASSQIHIHRLILTAVARHITRFDKCPLRSVRLSEHPNSGMLFEAWTSVEGPMVSLKKPTLSLWLRTGPLDPKLAMAILESACTFLPLRDIELVSIPGLEQKLVWSTKFRYLPNIHTIHLNRSHPGYLLTAKPSSNPLEAEGSQEFLPNLRILLFTEVFFDTFHLGLLANVLIRRQRAGSGLTHVQFDRCRGVSAMVAKAIQNVVGSVAWTEANEEEDDEIIS